MRMDHYLYTLEMTSGTFSDHRVFADQFVLRDDTERFKRAQRRWLTLPFLFILSSLNDSCCALRAKANSEN